MLDKMPRLTKESASSYAVRVLRHNIVILNLKPGQFISENEIALDLEISRTPVREAFIRLADEGLLKIYPQRGTCVSLIDLAEVEQSRFIRNALEEAIAERACDIMSEYDIERLEENTAYHQECIDRGDILACFQADAQFHRIMYEGCHVAQAYNHIEALMTNFDRVRILSAFNGRSVTNMRTVDDHRKIIYAVRARNKQLARQYSIKHLGRIVVGQEILKQQYPMYFK